MALTLTSTYGTKSDDCWPLSKNSARDEDPFSKAYHHLSSPFPGTLCKVYSFSCSFDSSSTCGTKHSCWPVISSPVFV
ncbi:hypothetical protein OIU84_012328 [Salix udensis]|uniref:Uncharacterized protein n=1 Tax=Salix udensis TaxID=889485 RepID=A0AAD6JHB6_9ROSI|nr:hypothetical protein OIU84_012328 [Salix udensis]